MLSKKVFEQLVEKYSKLALKSLEFTKKLQSKIKIKCEFNCKEGFYGCTFFDNGCPYTVVIYREMHHSEVEVMCTVIHELLHVKMDGFKVKGKVEEKFIQSIEKLIKTIMVGKFK